MADCINTSQGFPMQRNLSLCLCVCLADTASPPVSSRQHSKFCQNWVQELYWIGRALKEEKALLKVSLCISIRVVIWNFLSVSLSLFGGQINHISKGKREKGVYALLQELSTAAALFLPFHLSAATLTLLE